MIVRLVFSKFLYVGIDKSTSLLPLIFVFYLTAVSGLVYTRIKLIFSGMRLAFYRVVGWWFQKDEPGK